MALNLKLIDQKCWQISPYLAQFLAVEEGENVWLHVGNARCEALVSCHNNYPSMNLNKQWAANLKLTPGKWKVRRLRNGVRLGPVIGIICGKLPTLPPVETYWFRYLSAIDGGIGILLTPEGFDQERRCVYGVTLSEDKLHWVKGEMPWPDSIYVRIPSIQASLKAFLQKEYPNRHFNTPTLLNRRLVFQTLSQSQEITPYLPITKNNRPLGKGWLDQFSNEDYRQACNFYVLLQKYNDGLWHISRLHEEYGILSKSHDIKEVFRICIRVALILEKCFGQFGELGLDWCIDDQGNFRIQEVHSLPSDYYFTDSSVSPKIYAAPMLYSAYLSGFSEVIYPLVDTIAIS